MEHLTLYSLGVSTIFMGGFRVYYFYFFIGKTDLLSLTLILKIYTISNVKGTLSYTT